MWGDYTKRNVLVLEMFCEKYNCIDFLLILEDWRASALRRGWRRHRDAQNSTTTPTYILFPSLSSRSIPFTSMNRQAMGLDGTMWLASDRSRPLYTCCDINSPICGGIRSRESQINEPRAMCRDPIYAHWVSRNERDSLKCLSSKIDCKLHRSSCP